MDQFAYAYSVIERVERAETPTVVLNEVAHAARHFGLEQHARLSPSRPRHPQAADDDDARGLVGSPL